MATSRPRASAGTVYRLRDPDTGEVRPTWWLNYVAPGGRRVRESAGTTVKAEAVARLRVRMGEVASGLLVALGFLGPVGPALMISVMTVAMVTVHWTNGIFAMKNGIELPLLYVIASIVFAVVGYGAYSVDTILGIAAPWSPGLTWGLLAAGLLGGLANTALRQRKHQGTA